MYVDRKQQLLKELEAIEMVEALEKDDPELLEALKSILTGSEPKPKKACPSCGTMLDANRIPTLHLDSGKIHMKGGDFPLTQDQKDKIKKEW